MARKRVLDDAYVLIEPEVFAGLWRFVTPEETAEACDRIVPQIKRHIDGVASVRTIRKYANQCEFCESPWSEPSETYNGGCCAKDEEANPERAKEPA